MKLFLRYIFLPVFILVNGHASLYAATYKKSVSRNDFVTNSSLRVESRLDQPVVRHLPFQKEHKKRHHEVRENKNEEEDRKVATFQKELHFNTCPGDLFYSFLSLYKSSISIKYLPLSQHLYACISPRYLLLRVLRL